MTRVKIADFKNKKICLDDAYWIVVRMRVKQIMPQRELSQLRTKFSARRKDSKRAESKLRNPLTLEMHVKAVRFNSKRWAVLTTFLRQSSIRAAFPTFTFSSYRKSPFGSGVWRLEQATRLSEIVPERLQ